MLQPGSTSADREAPCWIRRAQNEAQRSCDMTQALCDAVQRMQEQERSSIGGSGSWSWFRSQPQPADPHADHMREQAVCDDHPFPFLCQTSDNSSMISNMLATGQLGDHIPRAKSAAASQDHMMPL